MMTSVNSGPGLSHAGSGAGQLSQRLFDAVMATSLLVALGLVPVFDRSERATKTSLAATPVEEKVEEVVVVEPNSPKTLNLAVTPIQYDNVGKLLEKLGKGYQYASLEHNELLDGQRLVKYDVIFLTCGGAPSEWLETPIGAGSRGSTEYTMKPDVHKRLHDSLRAFVKNGGTLYASDWMLQVLSVAFPELMDPSTFDKGAAQEIEAKVLDNGLRDVIGDTIHLNFDLDGWYPAALRDRQLTSYIAGKYRSMDGNEKSAPLLVKLPFGKGTILFTSFHNEQQNSKIELELLKYLVFTTVTAREESKLAKTMVTGGFSPQKQSLLSTSPDAPSVTRKYDCQKPGKLQFSLAFEPQGAQLSLEVTSPNGKKYHQEGNATFNIIVDDAQVGEWEYTVTAKKVPFENFPFSLSVWQK